MPEELRVDGAAARTMASGWGTMIANLNATAAPAGLGLFGQAGVAAVDAAHVATAAFRQALAAQVQNRGASVADACADFTANEHGSADEIAGVLGG
jgi:hypothetical protein